MSNANEASRSDREPSVVVDAPLGPVQRKERIDFLDTARGLALLGILFVNVEFFSGPFGRFFEFKPEPGLVNHFCFYFVKVLCEGKFYTLFSLLFGIGVAIQWSRAERARRSYVGTGVRRMLMLMGIGLIHGLFLWYGDILLTYGACGLLLLIVLRWRPSSLGTAAAVMLSIATLLTAGLSAVMEPSSAVTPAAATASTTATSPEVATDPSAPSSATPVEAQPVPEGKKLGPPPESPFLRLFDGYGRGDIPQNGGPDHPFWMQQETRAFKEGPWIQATLFRGLIMGMILMFSAIGLGWGIIGMFILGAAMWKSGVVAQPAGRLVKLLFFAGLPVGLGLAVIPPLLAQGNPGMLGRAVIGFISLPAGALVALGYFSGVKLWVESGRARGLAKLLGNVGRFGLTNYIMQTVICTFVFYHWGLALFDEFSRGERFLLVIGVYAFQVILSAVLTRWLAFGPLEWVWRSFTYLKLQPLLKRGRAGAAAE